MPQSPLKMAGTDSGSAIVPPLEPIPVREVSLPNVSAAQPVSPPAKPEWVRLVFHILSISLAGALALVVEDPVTRGGVLCSFLALFALFEVARTSRLGWFSDALNRIVVRPQERTTRSASMDFMAGFAVCFLLFDASVLAAVAFITAWCDPMARLIGVSVGSYRWPQSRKTIEGSITCALLAGAIAGLCVQPLSLPGMVGVGLAAMFAELAPQRVYPTRFGDIITPADNFYIPLASGVALSLFLPVVR
jgi:dolichol kinase